MPRADRVEVAGVTKLGLARHYERIADWVVPHLLDRPLTLVRCPTGVPPSARAQASTASS
jgi:DNA primase